MSLNCHAVIVKRMAVPRGRVSSLYLYDHPIVTFCPVSPYQCKVQYWASLHPDQVVKRATYMLLCNDRICEHETQ